MDYNGKHAILDAWLLGWPGDSAVLEHCEAAIAESGMTVVCSTVKRFEPHGVTAVWILAESHFTVHTYPEHGYLSADCYTCGTEGDPEAAMAALRRLLPVARAEGGLMPRGVMPACTAGAGLEAHLHKPAEGRAPAAGRSSDA